MKRFIPLLAVSMLTLVSACSDNSGEEQLDASNVAQKPEITLEDSQDAIKFTPDMYQGEWAFCNDFRS